MEGNVARKYFQLMADEKEVIDGFANKIGFFGGGGGKLVLTTHRLIFTNRRKTQIKMDIPLKDVLHIGRASSATIWSAALLITLFMKNAVRITLSNGSAQRFVVTNRDRWIDLIKDYRTRAGADALSN
jgi:hypothetical protein